MLLTTGQAAEELGCATTTFRRLVQADVLPGLSRRGNRVMVPLEVVQALRDRQPAPLERLAVREIAVLRADVAKPAPEDDDRAWIGYAAHLSVDDLLKSLRGWWRCDAASVAAGGVLPVTLSGYVVAVLSGLDTWEKEGGRHAFPDAVLAGHVTDLACPTTHLHATDAQTREVAGLLLGTRLISHSGGAIAYTRTSEGL
ncbi:helix-turn-helix domain-containing protein [Streptomyces sp. NPDC097617]|uniref:helix-turn-helix domain-containing protein n=1 Tax=Streptomyces sp. NPDC097617 TaxID=3366091 RepID=UPI00382C334B